MAFMCMIDDGKNPFEGQENIETEEKIYPETETVDPEIESVVDDFESGEELSYQSKFWTY